MILVHIAADTMPRSAWIDANKETNVESFGAPVAKLWIFFNKAIEK
jgi:hypothetical protein